jgi:hypothetical protein
MSHDNLFYSIFLMYAIQTTTAMPRLHCDFQLWCWRVKIAQIGQKASGNTRK